MGLDQVFDHITTILLRLIFGKVDNQALLHPLMTFLKVRSLVTKLNISLDFERLSLGQFAQEWVKIQLEGIASHLDDNFAHKLKLRGRVDFDLVLLCLGTFPTIEIIHGNDK